MGTKPANPARGGSTRPIPAVSVGRGAWRVSARRGWCVLAGVALWMALAGPAAAAEAPTLLAPAYPGAKQLPDVNGKNCEQSGYPCNYMTKDSLEKVMAFYAGKFGAAQVIDHSKLQGRPSGFIPLESFHVIGEMGTGWVYTGVFIEGLATPVWPNSDDNANALLRTLPHFSRIMEAVNWTKGQGLGYTGLRSIEEMKTLFNKYAYLEARYYLQGADGRTPVEVLLSKYGELAEQRVKRIKEQGKAQQERAQQNMQQDMMSKVEKSQQDVARGGSAEGKQESAEMEALLKRKPKLRAQLNPLSKKMMEQMQAGKMDEAEATGDQMDKLMRSDAEVSALLDKQEQRIRQRDAKEGANIQQFMQSQTDSLHANEKAVNDARWNTWRDYLVELAKQEQYVLRIEIRYPDEDPKTIRDRAVVLKRYQGSVAENEGKPAEGGRFMEEEKSASAPASSQPAVSSKKPAEKKPDTVAQPEQTAQAAPDKKKKEQKQKDKKGDAKEEDTLGGAAKQGMNMLKKLF